MGWRVISACAGLLLAGAATAQKAGDIVSTPAATLRLFHADGSFAGTVPTAGWSRAVKIVAADPDDPQHLTIAYPGAAGSDVSKGSYKVRKSALGARNQCTMAPATPGERDTRGGGNGAGTFCQTGE